MKLKALRFLMRQSSRALALLAATLSLSSAGNVAATNWAVALVAADTANSGTHGVRQVLYLGVNAEPNSWLFQQNSSDRYTAALTVIIRVSAHSQESNFFGNVPAVISNFDLVKGSTKQEVWKDLKCHHERGFPKITIMSIDGTLTSGQSMFPVAARFRATGMKLPGDEVMPSRRLASGTDGIGPFTETRTETKQSRLFVDLRLYNLACDLNTGAP